MAYLYHTLISGPIINAMVMIYNYLPIKDLGVTIILLTILIRVLLLPLSYKAARTQREITKVQPKLKEIQAKYKDNKEEQAKKLMEIYKEHKINPLSGIVPILIQLPVLIALYRAFMGFINDPSLLPLYSFVKIPETINATFLGIIDLAVPSIALAVVAGALQFAFSRIVSPPKSKTKKKSSGGLGASMTSQMTYFLPVLTVILGAKFPAGLPLYWSTTTLFSLTEQIVVKRKSEKKDLEKGGSFDPSENLGKGSSKSGKAKT
jgi:YidC/Oxa1 family membrane protein insertase